MTAKADAARIAELRELLHRANRAYYVDAAPFMSDTEFDRLLAELGALEERHPELADPASPTQRVGGEAATGFAQVTHRVPMMSVDNTYSTADLRAWWERCERLLGRPFAAVADPKVDGVAISLRYERGRLVELGPAEDIVQRALHPYTQALLSAEPVALPAHMRAARRIILQGEIPSPLDPPSGCGFGHCSGCLIEIDGANLKKSRAAV